MINTTNESEEIKVIKKLKRSTTSSRMYVRYSAVILHLRGYTNRHISGILEVGEHTIGRYIRSYKEKGVDGLIPNVSPGRNKLLSDEQESQLFKVITTKTPDEVSFLNKKNWTASIACKWVMKSFQIRVSERGMLDIFKRLNLTYTRPTYTLAKADPTKQKEFLEKFEELKKTLF
jgi:transposase